MFPRFDKLLPEHMDHVADALVVCDVDDAVRGAQCLVELRQMWVQCGGGTESTPEWYVILQRLLQEVISPLLFLQATTDFVRATPKPQDAFALFTESPRSLDILGRFSSGSPFLTQVLLRDPESLGHLTRHRRIAELKPREQFVLEAQKFLTGRPGDNPLRALRQFQRREQLRIGMCDIFGLLSLQYVTLQLSLLADALVRVCLELAIRDAGVDDAPFAVLALGKHGGEELNYSSDIDLVLVGQSADRTTQAVARRMVDGLNEHLGTGFLYRVDLRLRPWGGAGPLVTTPDSWREYLTTHAELWEKQALLKARYVTGSRAVAIRMLEMIPEVLFTESAKSIRAGIRQMKDRIESVLQKKGKNETEVKLGSGSIRDVEFLVQSLQLIHGRYESRVASANTLDALVRLTDFGLLAASDFQQLRDGYVFLRAIEHALQLQHNQQTHEIPHQENLRDWLALRMDYPDESTFMDRFTEHRLAIRRIFDHHFRSDERPKDTLPSSGMRVRTELLSDHRQPDQLDDTVTVRLRDVIARAELAKSVQSDLIAIDAYSAVLLICLPDESELLPVISGVLFCAGIDIRRGWTAAGPRSVAGVEVPAGLFAARLTVTSQLKGTLPEDLSRFICTRVEQLLTRMRGQGVEAVRQELVALFCLQMEAIRPERFESPDAAELRISDEPAPDNMATLVRIRSVDNPGFLFELSNALSLCRYRVRQASIDTSGTEVEDELFVTEIDGHVPLSRERAHEMIMTVTLIQQFMLWLQTSADPGTVLLRFRRLLLALFVGNRRSESAIILSNPNVLRRVARVLGLSRHLWEDALQHQEHLIPLLANSTMLEFPASAPALHEEINTALEDVAGGRTRQPAVEVLNQFKDRHLFRIELRHVLGHCRAFGDFSSEITSVAEATLEAAASIAWEELAMEDGQVPDCPWTLAGLGKFGGVEMGYASDIELLLVYDSDERDMEGRWFERLINRTTEMVSSRHDGIFEMDLRMRPWGQAGSAAVSLQQFEAYYSAAGNAWPYERQALIKLRSFGANVDFGRIVMDARSRAIYDGRSFSFAAMKGMREEQVRQHVRPGTIHAKLSEGCLVDLEYSVQALQLSYGHQFESLQTENTLMGLTAAFEAKLVSELLWERASDAYRYFRQLIDCLRMVRGNARDLVVPDIKSDEGIQLGRRLAQIYADEVSLSAMEVHREATVEFSEAVRVVCDRPH